ncbi:MAG: protein kinase domain-containing protein [Roseiflexaceae bacterium]
MTRYTTATGASISTDKKLGAGGEGTVYTVVGQPHSVAKIYHAQRLNQALAHKVQAMVANPPQDDTRNDPKLRHVSIAWPEQVLFSGGKFVGYVMPKIPRADDLYDLLQPQQRAKQHPHANHRTIYRIARNFALAMAAIHRKNYVIGDVNFKNALFSDTALITIVDCDSMQVTEANGTVHRCLVGLPEYTAPELQGADFSKVNRTTDSDTFGLAVLIFQMLMQGFHPFAGRPLPGAPDVEQVHVYCIKHTIFPYEQNPYFEPPKAAPPITALPGVIRTLMQRALTERKRPSAQEWADALEMVEQRLIQCNNDAEHLYPADGACVICEVDYNTGRRKRTSAKQTTQMQVPLPARTPTTPLPVPPAPSPPPAPRAQPFRIPPTVTPPTTPTGISLPQLPQWRRFLPQNRMALAAIGVILVSIFFLAANWNSRTSTESTVISDTATRAPIATQMPEPPAATLQPTLTTVAVPTTSAAAPSIALPACDANALLTTIWPGAYGTVYPEMLLNGWPQTMNDYFGEALTVADLPTTTVLQQTDFTRSQAPACESGQVERYAIDAPNMGSGLMCTDATCPNNQPFYREYSVMVIGENTPSKDNAKAGKPALARFFSRPGSQLQYTVHIMDATASTYERFVRYQAPIVQHQFIVPRDNDFTPITVSSAPVWYDVATGVQRRPASALLESWQRTMTIPDVLRWKKSNSPVRPNDYVRWFAGCDSQPAEVIQCQYIVDIKTVNNQQITVTYIPGLPKEMAKLIQPFALPPAQPAADITDPATMLSDTMSDWQCSTAPTINSWQCETVSTATSSDSNVALFSLHDTLQSLVQAMDAPYDLIVTSADMAPQLATVLTKQSLPANYTIELVPTGALYALVRE